MTSPIPARLLAALTALGLAARLALSWVSLGSNDWVTWRYFGTLVLFGGPYAYEIEPTVNHPPVPLLWSCLTLLVSAVPVGVSYPFIFRLPAILADLGSCVLLRRVWAARTGSPTWGWVASAAMAWNLNAILVGAYHCNTDNVVAFLTLLSAYLLAERKDPFRAGLALAAAVNVKLVPVVLIPALLSAAGGRDAGGGWRAAGRFVLGLAAGVPPFLVVLAVVPAAFERNALRYTPLPSEWGMMLFALYAVHLPVAAGWSAPAVAWLATTGKAVMLAGTSAVGLGNLLSRRRYDAYDLSAAAWAAFLVLTPGFGVQYTVYVVPLMLAVDLRWGSLYGLVAGLYALTAYAGAWDGRLPIQSVFTGRPNPLPVPIGLVAWAILAGFAWAVLRGRAWGWDRSPREAPLAFNVQRSTSDVQRPREEGAKRSPAADPPHLDVERRTLDVGR